MNAKSATTDWSMCSASASADRLVHRPVAGHPGRPPRHPLCLSKTLMAPMPLVKTVISAASRCRATNSVVVPASRITTAPAPTLPRQPDACARLRRGPRRTGRHPSTDRLGAELFGCARRSGIPVRPGAGRSVRRAGRRQRAAGRGPGQPGIRRPIPWRAADLRAGAQQLRRGRCGDQGGAGQCDAARPPAGPDRSDQARRDRRAGSRNP